MEQRDSGYRAYMVRLWRVDEVGDATWRVSVEDVHTGERRGFVDLEAFHAFLKETTLDVDPDAQSERHS